MRVAQSKIVSRVQVAFRNFGVSSAIARQRERDGSNAALAAVSAEWDLGLDQSARAWAELGRKYAASRHSAYIRERVAHFTEQAEHFREHPEKSSGRLGF
jgi:hypothetical protein